MRKFDFIHPEFEEFDHLPEVKEGEPCYEPGLYDTVQFETCVDEHKSLIFTDITSVLLYQEKYRRLIGDANVQRIMQEMHPTPATLQDSMTDEQRFNSVISRHCQTMSERQAVLSELASRSSELKSLIESMNASEPASASSETASAGSE